MQIQQTVTETIAVPVLNRNDFVYLEMGHALPRFGRNDMGTLEMIPAYREKYANTGIYRTAYMYDHIDPYQANLFGDFYMDFDDENNLENAREDLLFVVWKMSLESGFHLPLDAFHIFYSGKKGFHLTIPWQYMGIQPSKDLDGIFRLLAQELREQSIHQTIDMSIYERRRLYRLENSIHPSTGLYKVPISYQMVAQATIEEIQAYASKPRRILYPLPYILVKARSEYQSYVKQFEDWVKNPNFGKKHYDRTIDFIPHCIQVLIDAGPVKGSRNNTAAILTSFWKNQGCSEEEIFDNLLDWSQGTMTKREMGEIKTTMKSILRKDVNYGCRTLRDCSECIGAECKLYREKKGDER